MQLMCGMPPVGRTGSENLESSESSKKRIGSCGRQLIAIAVIVMVCVLLNFLSWKSTAFTDIYNEYIFPVIRLPGELLTTIFPFSVGEVLIALAVILVIIGIPAAIISAIAIKKHRGRILRFTGLFIAWVLVYIFATETLDCFVLYHTTTAADKYFPDAADGYTTEELTEMCEYLIGEANSLALQVERDENGTILLPDDLGKKTAEYTRIRSDRYPQLSGFSPRPKKIMASKFMSQLDLQGIYFPFTMEMNYNGDMCPSRVPCTVCHELMHTKGYIREDEAGFLACAVCIESGDPLFMYSGFLSAMNYSVNSVFAYINNDEKVRLYTMISDQVRADNKFVTDEYREKLDSVTLFKTETVSKASDKAMETSLRMNGVSDGKRSYTRMVDLLLDYYYEDKDNTP